MSNAPSGSLGVFVRLVDHLVDEQVIQLKPCELIQQQGDVCFIAKLATASQFSDFLDEALDVFHGLGLYRTGWVSGNGVWSTRVVYPLEHQVLELFIAERAEFGAQFIDGVLFRRE